MASPTGKFIAPVASVPKQYNLVYRANLFSLAASAVVCPRAKESEIRAANSLTGCDIPFTCLPILITTDGHYVGVLSLLLYQKLRRGRRRRLVNTTSSLVMTEAVSMTDSDVTDVLTVLTALTNSSVVCMSRSITSHDAGAGYATETTGGITQ